jgi:chorismate dehydratase
LQQWQNVLGRVSFVNCDPLYHNLPREWEILPAPPSWLTGHLLRKDCIIAPIPTADFAKNADKLQLIPGLGIVSKGTVGSVLLFGNRDPTLMRDIALPTDSSTSRKLMMWVLEQMGINPRPVDMGPDLEQMLTRCDGALLIGDRAMDEAARHPELVKIDLGQAWYELTGYPMVFGVFAAHKDTDAVKLNGVRDLFMEQLNLFQNDTIHRRDVIESTSHRSGFSKERVQQYFDEEVGWLLDSASTKGLDYFLENVCGINEYHELEQQ